MTTALQLISPLRLPNGSAETAAAVPADGLRARIEELGRRHFNGKMDLRTDDGWVAELLLRQGEPLALALGGPGFNAPLTGQGALTALVGQAVLTWTLRLEPFDEELLRALAGLGSAPESKEIENSEALRNFLRQLAASGKSGVLELASEERWGRTLLAKGRVLGSYSDSAPQLTCSLAPLGGLLAGPTPLVDWYAAESASPLILPETRTEMGDSAAEVERQVTWVVSRFEGAWARAREQGDGIGVLQDALLKLLEELLRLAGELEATRGNPAKLKKALVRLTTTEAPTRQLGSLDKRLGDARPEEACSVLVELVSDALSRIIRSSPESSLAECCRQTALTLETELRASFPAQHSTSNRAG